jgi:hypothetical protein
MSVSNEFEILESNVKLRDREGMAPALYGEIAKTSQWGLLIKTPAGGRSPFPLEQLWEWDATTRTRGRELGTTFDGYGVFERQLDRTACTGGTFPLTVSLRERELLQYIADQPHVSKILGIERHLPVRKFDLGRIVRPKVSRVDEQTLYEHLERHVSCDFGEFGRLDENATFSDEVVWSMAIQPREVQNSHAILVKNKRPIVSRYNIDKLAMGGVPGTISVLTLPHFDAERTCRTFVWADETSIRG